MTLNCSRDPVIWIVYFFVKLPMRLKLRLRTVWFYMSATWPFIFRICFSCLHLVNILPNLIFLIAPIVMEPRFYFAESLEIWSFLYVDLLCSWLNFPKKNSQKSNYLFLLYQLLLMILIYRFQSIWKFDHGRDCLATSAMILKCNFHCYQKPSHFRTSLIEFQIKKDSLSNKMQ